MASLTSAPALDGGVGSRKMEADAEGNYRFSVGAGVQIWVELEDATAAGAAPAAPATPSTLRVLEGDLEVAGVEAARGVSYTLRNSTPMYSHYGASVLLTGRFASVYVTTEHSQKLLLNLHARLEARREEAKRAGNAGPKVLIVGSTDTGKSTLARTLGAYAARVGRMPTFVDLDIGQGELSVPGTLSASPLDRRCFSIESGYVDTLPLTYFFGHTSPGAFVEVYRNSMQRLAENVLRSMATNELAASSGCIINTMGLVSDVGTELMLDIIKAFQVDVVVVMDHDRLFMQLSSAVAPLRVPVKLVSTGAATGAGVGADASAALPTTGVTVVKLPRQGGIVERPVKARQAARDARIKEYFYGPPPVGGSKLPALSPSSIVVGFDDVVIVAVGGRTSDAGILPIGRATTLDPLRTSVLQPSASLSGMLMGVSFATAEKQVPHTNVAGFVHVTSVDMEKRVLTLLSPCPGPLPSKYLITSSINKWKDA